MAKGGDQWEVISLPAIAESNDPLGRRAGEALWPEWENNDELAASAAQLARANGPRSTSSGPHRKTAITSRRNG
jgi:hypothetical protein